MPIEQQIQALLSNSADSADDDSELEFWRAWLAMASSARMGRPVAEADLAEWWPHGAPGLLDFAAMMVARHPGWEGSEQDALGWMSMLTASSQIAQHLGGEPRDVHQKLIHAVIDQAVIQGQAVQAIWQEQMLRSGAAAEALGANKDNREIVRRARTQSALLGLPQANRYLYPVFQFDFERRQIFPEVAEVNRHLDAAGDPWGVASWWIGRHDRLGVRPIDLVATERAHELREVADALFDPIG